MALVTNRRSPTVQSTRKSNEAEKTTEVIEEDAAARVGTSLNECYFANKGAALAAGAGAGGEGGTDAGGRQRSPARAPQPDIQHHLQAMFGLLRPEETLKMAVKLESAHGGRTRYLVVVCRGAEAALLGIDCNERTTVGLVLRVLADTAIKLDGDGGFSVCVCSQQHIFKPVSVQAMWSALQTLHRASGRARQCNHFAGGSSHAWCGYYEARVSSDRSCLNEWHAMDALESRRPPSPDSLRLKPRERDETERVIRCTLKEIMMSVDLDEVTSKVIRVRLEDELDMDLAEYKSFIDQEMIVILGQMDAPTEVFDHVYLGSEWNASNLEELQRNGVRHILNVTREIDNFFPGMFDYLNIRVYDDDKTDLLKHWDNTFKYINKARNEGSKVLVHCKMGISRSASVVIAYAMKAYNWNFDKALKHVRTKRSCIKPNTNFLSQLETYQGILDAMKNKEKLQRSKSETNLKTPKSATKSSNKRSSPTALSAGGAGRGEAGAGADGGRRPRSWSPDSALAALAGEGAPPPPTSVSLESLAAWSLAAAGAGISRLARHMLMPCAGGSYSVSPNQIIRLKERAAPPPPRVRRLVSEIESGRYQRLVFGTASEMSAAPNCYGPDSDGAAASDADAETIHTWDPGEADIHKSDEPQNNNDSDNIVKSDSRIIDVKSKNNDAFINLVERNLESDKQKKQTEEEAVLPSRQSSWSSLDSAVGPDLSRHSSWGSYDTRCVGAGAGAGTGAGAGATRPPAPVDLARITERETRRRAPRDIADNERKFNETCAILRELAEAQARMAGARAGGASTWCGRLSASAPADSWLRAGARRRRLAAASHGDLLPLPTPPSAAAAAAAAAGLVSNLKREFEALSGTSTKPDETPDLDSDSLQRPGKSRSLPAERSAPTACEDLSVKVLVNRYDNPKSVESNFETAKAKSSHELGSKKYKSGAESEVRARTASPFMRNSFCGALRGAGGGGGGAERPPIAPNVVSLAPLNYPSVVVSTVMSKAQNKKQLQHGKTHPLTRLNMNRSNNRCSNPVYNTM